MSGKSYQTKSSDKLYKYSQEKRNNSSEKNQYYQTSKYTAKHDNKNAENSLYNHSYKYPTKQDDKIYPQRHKVKTSVQTQPSNIYKYKIERDESGNCNYVLEEPEHNPFNLINNCEIKCVYPMDMTGYYKNVNIYNYKTYKRYNNNKK